MTDEQRENKKPLTDAAQLANQLVEFAKNDTPEVKGSLRHGRLSLLQGEVTQFPIMDGNRKATYDEDGDLVDYCDEPIEVIDVPLLDDGSTE